MRYKKKNETPQSIWLPQRHVKYVDRNEPIKKQIFPYYYDLCVGAFLSKGTSSIEMSVIILYFIFAADKDS